MAFESVTSEGESFASHLTNESLIWCENSAKYAASDKHSRTELSWIDSYCTTKLNCFVFVTSYHVYSAPALDELWSVDKEHKSDISAREFGSS